MFCKRIAIAVIIAFFVVTRPAYTAEKAPPAGNYEAHLWSHGVFRPGFPLYKDPILHLPVPLTLTFDDNGNFYGAANYNLPRHHIRSPLVDDMGPAHWKTSFDVRGSIDKESGDIHLEIGNGKILHGIGDGKGYRSGYEVEYNSSLKGARESPFMAKFHLDDYRLESGPGKDIFMWGGNTAVDNVSVHIDVRKYVAFSGIEELDIKDYTARQQQLTNKATAFGYIWHFHIAGPAKETPEVKKGKNLVSFAILPTGPVSMKTDETKRFYALGVYEDDKLRTVDLTNESNWSAGAGLKAAGKGMIKAVKPGKYTLTGRFKQKGKLVSSTVEINVTAPRK